MKINSHLFQNILEIKKNFDSGLPKRKWRQIFIENEISGT